MGDLVSRRLVHQVWKPLGGQRVERYVAMPSSHAVPDTEWTDDLPGHSYVENEVVGLAEVPSGARFDPYDEFAAFADSLQDRARVVSFRPDWADKLTDGSDDAEPDPEADDVLLTSAGYQKYDPDLEPIHLPEGAEEADIEPSALYRGTIHDIKPFGVFVHLSPNEPDNSEVTGLAHESNLGVYEVDDFELGDPVIVELDEFADEGPSLYLRDRYNVPGGETDG